MEKGDRFLLQKAKYNEQCLFKQKRLLDIGCNVGAISTHIAALYDPKVVIGVDVDPVLITAAIGQMHRVINDEECAKLVKNQISSDAAEDIKMLTEEESQKEAKLNEMMQRVQQLPKSFQLAIQGELQFLNDVKKTRQQQAAMNVTHSQLKECLYGKLNFRTENYIEVVDTKTVQREQFYIILCLSTIKWVHLSFGDIGLKTLLLKVKEQLIPGGLFIFDSQPWKSYKKALKEAKSDA